MRTIALHFLAFIPVLFSASTLVCAEDSFINELVRQKPTTVEVYDLKKLIRGSQVLVAMEFNSSVIINSKMAAVLKGKEIEKIELVYTAYRLSATFQQPVLNKQRLFALRELYPQVFESPSISYQFIAQTHGKNEQEAKELFHGFVITFRKTPTMETVKAETKIMAHVLKDESFGKYIFEKQCTTVYRQKRKYSGKYYPVSASERAEGKLYKNKGIWNRKRHYELITASKEICKPVKRYVVGDSAGDMLRSISDNIVIRVLERNAHWNDILFVADVTGSMSPYTTQLLLWNRLNFKSRKAKWFTFFNDGDNKPDRKKVIGHTGGIYHTEVESIELIEQVAFETMQKGGGGDGPENNMEALLEAIEMFPDAKEIIMIVDNFAPVKDIALLPKVSKPVRVIVCGNWGGIHPDYLKIAYLSKGSIHTLEEDIFDLMLLNDGKEIIIGNRTYRLDNGDLKAITKL